MGVFLSARPFLFTPSVSNSSIIENENKCVRLNRTIRTISDEMVQKTETAAQNVTNQMRNEK